MRAPRTGDPFPETFPESFPNVRRLEARGHWGIKRGLDNPRTLLRALGRPDQGYPVVLIAGTNGKGSTGAFLAHALRAAGLTVGWTTSPHLVAPTERIWIDGHFIGASTLDLLLGEVFEAEARSGIKATYFELMITAALLAFRMTGVELALVEVGMGGRWDATNALDPIVTALTHVGLDHQAWLGDTREAIAREKLCTAREGRPLVLGPSLDPDWVAPLLEVRPRLCPAPALQADALAWDHSIVAGHRIGLAGAHQLDNLAVAWEVVRQLQGLGFPLDASEVWRGFEQTRWPGRLWAVPGCEGVWMDGAHNPDGARVLAQHARSCGVRPHVVFGAMADKDLAGVAAALRTMEPRSLTLVKGVNERYADGEALRRAWAVPNLPVHSVETVAVRLREPADGPRLVTGSLFLLGDLLRALGVTPQP